MDDSSESESECQNKEDKLLQHVILSRCLPEDEPNFIENGEDLMNRMIENVENLAEWIPSKTIDLFKRLKRINVECTKSAVAEEIAGLRPGDTFAMFVRRQHCVIMVHMLPDSKLKNLLAPNIIVAVFPSTLHPQKIYEHGDIEFNYPVNAIKVEFSQMLRSEEFANQLCLLCEELPIGGSGLRNYVSKWLLTVLTDERSTTASVEEFPFITKKIRDESLGESKSRYFRRSEHYMSAKVILQHSLTMQLGTETGKFVYKLVMLQFLSQMCTVYKDSSYETFNIDLLSQMIAKLARRIEKLSENIPDTITEEIATFYSESIDDAKDTIAVIRSKINDQIQSIQDEEEEKSQLQPLRDLNFQEDLCHRMPKLRMYLGERLVEEPLGDSHSRYNINSYRRYKNRRQDGFYSHAPTEHENKLFWTDFENEILYHMSQKDEQMPADEIRESLIMYKEYAEEKYKGNPIMCSRMILVHLKLIAVIDRRATIAYPLFKKYRSGINSNIIASLLLPQRTDMETALHLEKYFRMRNETAHNPGLIEEKNVNEVSFSVAFARENDEIRNIRDAILKLDETNIQNHKARYNQGREKVGRIREQANRLGCTFLKDRSGESYHDGRCKRCHLIHEANKVRLEQYEHLLPKEEYQQFAVAFELRIPEIIAYLRDVLYGFVKLCSGTSSTLNIKGNWVEFKDISQFNESTSRFVTLGSTKRRPPEFIHVDYPFKRFLVQNSFNCQFHALDYAIPTSLRDDAIQNMCTFKTTNEYAGLQWTLNSTLHSENQVLARQSECPQNLSLGEYKNFGTLRADGYRLQLRKLFAMIETEALSFEKESVLLLVMQTLWECGERFTHSDLSEPKFCLAMIELLEKFVEQQKDNWMHQFKLLMATLITVRLFEINDDSAMADKIVRLLLIIRGIVWDWIEKIGDVMDKTHSSASERDLRSKLIYIAMTGSLTFFIYPKHKHYEKIFSIGKDLRTPHRSWLNFIIVMQNNLLLYEINEDQLPPNMHMFLRLVEICGIHSEAKMQSLIKQDAHEVFEVIKLHWSEAIYIIPNTRKIEFSNEYPSIYIFKAATNAMQNEIIIDIITGMFLVNGYSNSRLPLEIMQDESYQRVFGNTALEVQPNAQHRFSTVQRNSEFRYEFQKFNEKYIITERNTKDADRELIHHKQMYDEFPFLLVQNYSHWWNKEGNYIEFRQRTFGQKFASKDAKVDYRLDLNTYHLIDTRTQQRMLDIKSMSYRRIVKKLSRLEHPRYIHVMEESPNVICVELQRMKLKFKVDCTNEDDDQGLYFESIEFSGMRISDTQNIGTLYGLRNGLVLESSADGPNNKRKILLMPNGQIHSECTDKHVSVDIAIKHEHRSPLFFQYQIDEIGRQLKASNGTHESWFYIAYLHAITSHGEVEPFTGMSGTERALQILQSAFAWSSSPYEPEAIKLLNGIAGLSPIRKMVDLNHMASVTWPEFIPPRSAQDSFVFIAKKLLEDSQRLRELHSSTTSQELNIESDLTLNKRDYWRCLQLQPNLRVSDAFIERAELKTSLLDPFPFAFSTNTGILSTLYHTNSFRVPDSRWSKLLTNRVQLKGSASKKCIENILFHSVYEEFPDMWISLYKAIRKHQLNQEEIILILTLFSHQNKELAQAVLALQVVAMNPDAFEDIDPPSVDTFQLSYGIYSIERLYSSLRSIIFSTDDNANMAAENENQFKIDAIVDRLAAKIEENWPCNWVNLSEEFFDIKDLHEVNKAINAQLSIWNQNRKLFDFIDDLQKRFQELPQMNAYVVLGQYCPFLEPKPQNWPKYEINIEEKIQQNFKIPNEVLEKANNVWIGNEKELPTSAKIWWTIIEENLISEESKHLIEAGLFPRLIPSLLLPKLCTMDKVDPLGSLIGAWAVTIAREQREKRIEIYSQRPELKADMDRELENEPHINWRPCERPQWLIFEIEQNLTIREIQIKVAEQMIEPAIKAGVGAKHSVMQLNMGEGKTAVIVPILAAVLANGNQACQITVLKSLFSRNLKFLRQYLGGLLNCRIYTVPCRRNLPIAKYIDQIPAIYEECKLTKGVILTLPEYRLSMQLKAYESIYKEDIEAAKSLLNIHKWLNENVRNILDESDAILQSNYQLIYTVGNQQDPDGETQRWSVIQAVFKRIPIHMKKLYEKYGKEKVEFDDNYMKNKRIFGATNGIYRSDIFTPCRIIDEDMFDLLKAELVEDFLYGRMDLPEISEEAKKCVKYLLTEKAIDKKPSHLIENFPTAEQNILMIMSGLLRFEVLKLALTKRWRVNYGVDTKGERKMAIPFKAKDVAAEMTEFGHPDVAICFTQLSYYYSGLSDDQLYQLFDVLKNKQNPSSYYTKWIQSVPQKLLNRSILHYTGINLDNPNQRDQLLFPLLRFNMCVIDFWLESVVYPYEAKIFEKKLINTTWDLCSEQLAHRVTGFSGTNDTKNILPMPIAQNDLDELESTNENVRQILLQPENQSYESLPTNVSAKEILERLTQRNIPVLLDSGALMLELSNEQVAIEWLKLTSEASYDAAIYFDSRDILQTVDRNGTHTEFDCSVYRENLNRCLVYLDDVHTRGTDLKFPLNWKGVVTLSGDITRDKTVQTCMRMRQLGSKHSIGFWASCEADTRIRKVCHLSDKDLITNEHVIQFVSSNSKQLETTNMIHWTSAALNYTKKLIGHKLFDGATDEHSMQQLYAKCVDDEFSSLIDMYGDKEQVLLVDVAWSKFDKIIKEHKANREIKLFVRNIQDSVNEKLIELAPNVKKFSNALDDEQEQEKELEQELEEQRFVERPPAVKAATPTFDESLKKLILNGVTDEYMKTQRSLLSIAASLEHTQLFRRYRKKNKDAWAKHLFVTRDFKTVIDSSSQSCDEFLRSVWWIARVESGKNKNILILLSSYECNRLFSTFQKSKKSTLFMYRPRINKLHSNLLHETNLQVTGMDKTEVIDIEDEVQIGMYAGMMYFDNEDEQNAYCGFMGMIPRPRTNELERAVDSKVIEAKGYVPIEKRQYSDAISSCVSQCKFQDNPVDLAIKLVEAHHQTLLKESHVAAILERSTKPINCANDDQHTNGY